MITRLIHPSPQRMRNKYLTDRGTCDRGVPYPRPLPYRDLSPTGVPGPHMAPKYILDHAEKN